ncbi:hypothetical protein L6E12_26950 [Actinokineospora sp. PR83]|uniref:hypothetical protein n=1 Tax=Actinokineospora sp. PR83 TaxID=2884908 RepID=UPI001F2E2EC9|nr:hypothetical protein [Actinokineospora sp. PR83]MCG8919419.1 hypothetical protein [Actinokineospora sp. PR83]
MSACIEFTTPSCHNCTGGYDHHGEECETCVGGALQLGHDDPAEAVRSVEDRVPDDLGCCLSVNTPMSTGATPSW